MVKVLFVCLGNICRSPTAAGSFRKMVESAGLAHIIECESAGISDYHEGEPPDPRAVKAALARGIDLRQMRARQFIPEDFSRFDYILALDEVVLTELQRHAADLEIEPERVGLLLDYAPHLGMRDVPDPYLSGPKRFEQVLDLVQQGTAGLLERLKRETAR